MIIKNLNRLTFNYFCNLIYNNFKVDGKINFGSRKANNFFLKKISRCNYYFEIGAGNSTIIAEKKSKYFYSVETSKPFFNFMKKKINNKNRIKFFNLGLVGDYSYPVFLSKNKAINFINFTEKFLKFKKFPDLILVDGRYRVLFLLRLLKYKKKILSNKTCILLDDYKKRSYYKILNKFYSINLVGRMAKLVPKKHTNNNLYKKNKLYFYDAR